MFSLSRFPIDPSRYLDKRDTSVRTVIITPSHKADVCAHLVEREHQDTYPPELSAFCAGVFMYIVRGYPGDEIEVETKDEIYRVVRDIKTEKISIVLPKCNVLYTNKREKLDDIELLLSAFSYKNYIFKLTECKNICHFSDANLRTLLRSSLGDSIDGVAAYSVKETEAFIKILLLDEGERSSKIYILLAALTAAIAKTSSQALTLTYDGGRVCVGFLHGNLLLSDEELKTFKLSAPDIG